MGKKGYDNRWWTIFCCLCCGGWRKGSSKAFYFCGCRIYKKEDFCTKDGCIDCLLSQGARFWIMIWAFLIYLLIQAAILYSIQPETFENATSGTHVGPSAAYAMAIYFSFITDTTTCYGDILMAREPVNGRVALFFLANIGMLIIGLGVGATANALLQCLNNKPNTGFKFLNRVISLITKFKILAFIALYAFMLTVGSVIFMWLPFVENPDYGNTTALPAQHWGYDEAFYWSWVSFTTCGYGDITMQSVTGRMLQIFWATIAIGFFGSAVSLTAIFFEKHFDKILHKRHGGKLVSKTGKAAQAYVNELMEKIASDFPGKESRKELFQLFKDQIGEEEDKGHTHLGTQAKFGATHGAARHHHNQDAEGEDDAL